MVGDSLTRNATTISNLDGVTIRRIEPSSFSDTVISVHDMAKPKRSTLYQTFFYHLDDSNAIIREIIKDIKRMCEEDENNKELRNLYVYFLEFIEDSGRLEDIEK